MREFSVSNGFPMIFNKSRIAPGLWIIEKKWVFIYILQMSGLGVSNDFLTKMEQQRGI